MRPRTHAKAGFALLEVTIVIGLTATVLGTLVLLGQRASDTTAAHVVEDGLRQDAEDAVGQLMLAFEDAGAGSLDPNPMVPFWVDSLRFQEALRIDTSGVTWSATRRVYLEPDREDPVNGIDDDGDGVVDECVLVLVRDEGLPEERRRVLARGVRAQGAGEELDGEDNDGDGLVDESGFCALRDGDGLTIELTLERVAQDGERVIVTASSRTWMRN